VGKNGGNWEVPCDFGLPQADVAENKEHHHHETNQIDEVVHVASSFLSRDRITVYPPPSPRRCSESAGEEQHEEDNGQHPGETRGRVAIGVIAKVGQTSYQEQNENDQQQ
jgi:hypothetical protein